MKVSIGTIATGLSVVAGLFAGVEALAERNGPFGSRHDDGAQLRTFCRQNGTDFDAIALSFRGDPVAVFSTSLNWQCENVLKQMAENSNCFCGKPASGTDHDLVCVDRRANPRHLGSFSFSYQCEKARDELVLRDTPNPQPQPQPHPIPGGDGVVLRTFCQQRGTDYDVVALSLWGTPKVVFTTSLNWQCENVLKQMAENSNCFCGKPTSGTDHDLVCVDRQANPRHLGSFSFSYQCESALNDISRRPF